MLKYGIVAGMKKDIHPENYRPVIFLDNSSGKKFLIGSTVDTTETAKWEDGKQYPLAAVEISSASHPFYTGKEKVMDIAGRVEKFKAHTAAAKAKAVERKTVRTAKRKKDMPAPLKSAPRGKK